jgi:hypothetical protein
MPCLFKCREQITHDKRLPKKNKNPKQLEKVKMNSILVSNDGLLEMECGLVVCIQPMA